jgi:hypothetical protein
LTLGNTTKTLAGGTLINDGLCVWNGGQINLSGFFRIGPGGTLDLRANGAAFNTSATGPTLVNEGTLRKSGGTGVTACGVACINTGLIEINTGTLSVATLVQDSGQTLLNGGQLAFTMPQSSQFFGGVLAGSGTITGSLYNNATIRPSGSPWQLRITGGYSEGSNAVLQVGMGSTNAASGWAQLVVEASAALAGTLEVTFTNGFTPAPGQLFTVLLASPRTGTFSTVRSPGNILDVAYSPSAAVLEFNNVPPTADLWVEPVQTVCRTFRLRGWGSDPDGAVTNLALFWGTNVLASKPGSQAECTLSCDIPGDLVLSALATDNRGATGSTNVTVQVTTLPQRLLDAVGFQTSNVFKLCLADNSGTNYQMLASDDPGASNWVVLGPMQGSNGVWRFLDSTTTNAIHRVYRAQRVP